MNTFKTNWTYTTRSTCNHDCIFEGVITKRTAKTVTIKMHGEDAKRCKVHLDHEGNEFIFPLGRYSMAPVFNATVATNSQLH